MTALLNGVDLDCEREFSNILNGGFPTDHSEPLGLVFDMPLCMLALWHLIKLDKVYWLGLTIRLQVALSKCYL